MVLLSLSFDSLHGILRRLYDEMTELCQPMMTLATAIAALGALFYIAYRVWQSLSRAEPVDVFGMLRPFCLGICILFFDVIVLGKPERYPEPRRAGERVPCSTTRPST